MGFGGLVNTESNSTQISNTANYADSFNDSRSVVTTQGDIGNTTLNLGGGGEAWEKIVPYAMLAVVLVGAFAFLKGGFK